GGARLAVGAVANVAPAGPGAGRDLLRRARPRHPDPGVPVLHCLHGAPATIVAANWLTHPLQTIGLMPPLTVRNFDLTCRDIIALMICYSAFLSEVFRAGIQAVPEGQVEAARALGLSPRQIFRKIVAPQACRIILP